MNKVLPILVVIESPFQCWNFIEYCYANEIDINNVKIIINLNSYVSPKNLPIIENVFKYFNVSIENLNVIYIDVISSKKNVILNRKKIINSIKCFDNVSYLIVGEFRSALSRYISNMYKLKKLVILDDGNAMKRIPNSRLYNIKDIALFFLGYNFFFKQEKIFFSLFLKSEDMRKNWTLKKNNLNFKRELDKKLATKDICFDGHQYIIGSPLSEAGVCEEEVELDYLRYIKKWIMGNYPDVKLVYMPHRREDTNKLNKVKKIFNCQIDQQLIPIELKVSLNTKSILYGCYSSCFETFLLMDNNIKIFSFDISERVNISWREFVKKQYNDYRKIKHIDIIDMP